MADATVTAQAVIDESLCRLKDPHDTKWKDAELLAYLNKGYNYIHRLMVKAQSEIGMTTTEVTMVASQQEYSLPDDFYCMAVEGVFFSLVSKPLTPVTFTDKIRETSTEVSTSPTMYYLTASNIGLINIPNATSVAAYPTLALRYFKRVTPLMITGSTAINMPWKNMFNDAMSIFMDTIALMRDDMNSASIAAVYNELEQQAIEIINLRLPVGVTQ